MKKTCCFETLLIERKLWWLVGAPDAPFPHPRNPKNTLFRKSAKTGKNTCFRCHLVFWPQKRVPWFWEPSKISKNNSKGDSGRGAWLFQLNVFEKNNILIKKRVLFVFVCVSREKVAFRRECVFTFFTFPIEGRVTFRRQKSRKTQKREILEKVRTWCHKYREGTENTPTCEILHSSKHPNIQLGTAECA